MSVDFCKKMEDFRNQVHNSLYIHTSKSFNLGSRMGKLYDLLAKIKSVSENTVEELFFKHIGKGSIVKLITEHFKDHHHV